MSRVYFTATFKHKDLPIPTFSFETNDHTGGGYEIGGLHPSSIAALIGKPPDVKPGERFDLKFNLNKQRTSLSLVVFTTKHLPHVEWSSDGGMGRLPLAGMGALVTQFFKTGTVPNLKQLNSSGKSSKTPSKRTTTSSSSATSRNKRVTDARRSRAATIPSSTSARQIEDWRRRSSRSERNNSWNSPNSRRDEYDSESSSRSTSRSRSRSRSRSTRQRRSKRDYWDDDSGYVSDDLSFDRGRKDSSRRSDRGRESRRKGR